MEYFATDGDLFQWDLGRKVRLTLPEGESASVVEFTINNETTALVVEVNDNEAEVPNILLQNAGGLRMWAVALTVDGRQTRRYGSMAVFPRPKPDDYVYTETQVRQYENLDKRIKELGEDIEKNARDIGRVGEQVEGLRNQIRDLEQVYELIETVDLDEEAVIERTLEPDGTPYSFRAMKIKAKSGGVAITHAANMYYYAGTVMAGAAYYKTITASISYHLDEIYHDNGYWESSWSDWGTSASSGTVIRNVNSRQLLCPAAEYPAITKVASSNTLPVGTYEIWGVRA